MRILGHDTDSRVLIVAEVGNNHEGDLDVAKRLVHEAGAAGADAVKFQTFRTEHLVSPANVARFDQLKRFELPLLAFEELARSARDCGVFFISTPFDPEVARELVPIVDALKIASGDNTFWPLIDAAADCDRPLIVSTGLASLEDLRVLAERLVRLRGSLSDVAFLHCVSSYPAPIGQVNLRAIATINEALRITTGYSDHTLGIDVPVAAVAAGARIIEKHFTLDKGYSSFRDHQLSADPSELRELVRRIREVELMLGSGVKGPQSSESEGIAAFRRSIVAARDLPAGHRIGPDDLTWIRPAGGLPPGSEELILGRVVRRAIATAQRIALDDLAPEPR